MKKVLRYIVILVFALTLQMPNIAAQSKVLAGKSLPELNSKTPKKYVIENIDVKGVSHLNPDLLLSSVGLVKGDSIYLPSEYISNVINQLWGYRYYSDIDINVEVEDDKAFLELVVQERPRVSEWTVSGVKPSQGKEIKERLKLKERTELSDFALKNSEDIIKDYLFEKGFRNGEVKITQTDDPRLDNFVMVDFEVTKNLKTKIKSINITGNKNLSESKLKKAMKSTREKSIPNFFKSAKLNDDDYKSDKVLLSSYMQSKGYRDGRILKDSVYYVSDNRIAIDIEVDEGDKYYYRDITWVGNEKHSSESLNMLLGIQKGDTYDKDMMEDRLGIGAKGSEAMMNGVINVSTIYQNDGHLAFELKPVENVVNGDSIDLEIKINEGSQFTINNVNLSGNGRTNDRVIRRELYIRPGELYDQSMIIHSIRQLGSMGHFNAENIQPDIQPVSDGLVDIGFALEETPSDQFEVSGGWGGGMFVASVAVTFNNISMRKFFEKGAWKPYPAGDNQKLRISAQTNGTYYTSVSLSFVEPWLGGKKPTSLSTSLYYSTESDDYYDYYNYYNNGYNNGYYNPSYGNNNYSSRGNSDSGSHFTTIGASIGLSKRLSWPDPNFTLMGELSYQAYLLDNWSGFLMKNGISNTVAFSATLGRNSTDQQIYPRRGSEMFLKAAFTPPYSLFNDVDYSNQELSDQDRYRWIEYYKLTSMARFFLPMLPNNKLVLMTRAEFGYLGSYDPNNLSPFEGFYVGGDGVSGYSVYGYDNIGLRGYENGALTPYAGYGVQAKAYAKYTTELRYPIVLSPQSNVYALAFAEAGNAYYDWKTFNAFDVRRSAGIGLRLYLPIVGMFGIDWAYGFDSPTPSSEKSGSQFHFSIGQSF